MNGNRIYKGVKKVVSPLITFFCLVCNCGVGTLEKHAFFFFLMTHLIYNQVAASLLKLHKPFSKSALEQQQCLFKKSDKILCSLCVSKYLCVIEFPDGNVPLCSQFIALNFPVNTFASGHCSPSHTRGKGFSLSSANIFFYVFWCHRWSQILAEGI